MAAASETSGTWPEPRTFPQGPPARTCPLTTTFPLDGPEPSPGHWVQSTQSFIHSFIHSLIHASSLNGACSLTGVRGRREGHTPVPAKPPVVTSGCTTLPVGPERSDVAPLTPEPQGLHRVGPLVSGLWPAQGEGGTGAHPGGGQMGGVQRPRLRGAVTAPPGEDPGDSGTVMATVTPMAVRGMAGHTPWPLRPVGLAPHPRHSPVRGRSRSLSLQLPDPEATGEGVRPRTVGCGHRGG